MKNVLKSYKLWSIITICTVLLLCLCLLPTQAQATGTEASGTCEEDLMVATTQYPQLNYTISDGEAIITDCDPSASGTLTIPATLSGYPVTGIGYWAFYDCDFLTGIIVPESVVNMDANAFYGCASLKEIYYGGSVEQWIISGVAVPETIDVHCAIECGGTEGNVSWDLDVHGVLTISGTGGLPVRYWHEDNYSKRSAPPWESVSQFVKKLVIEEGITYIGDNNFIAWQGNFEYMVTSKSNFCNLKTVILPKSLTTFSTDDCGRGSFYGTMSVTDVYYAGTQSQWAQISAGGECNKLNSATIHYNYGTPQQIDGDIDGNEKLTTNDVIQLLLHVTMPDTFPVDVEVDFTGDGYVTIDDVFELLLHLTMPDIFPLNVYRKTDI